MRILIGYIYLNDMVTNQLHAPAAQPWWRRSLVPLGFVFATMIVIIAAVAVYLRSQEDHSRALAMQELDIVLELKVADIERWRSERLGDGAMFHENPIFLAAVRKLRQQGDQTEIRAWLEIWLSRSLLSYRYDSIYLFDERGVALLGMPDGQVEDPVLSAAVPAYILRDSVGFLDLYRNPLDSRIYLSVMVPLGDGSTSGLLALRIDPERYLYPYIMGWPGISDTAETLLVRGEDEDAVLLNPVRFNRLAALDLRFKLSESTRLPATLAVLGKRGDFTGQDYRGVPVLAMLGAIKDSPWFIVAKRDRAEVYAETRTSRIQLVMLVVAVLSLGLTITGLLRMARYWQVKLLSEKAAAAERLHENELRGNEALLTLNQSLERQVARRTAELQASNQELEAFAYSVAHDLRAPLRSIDGFSRVLQEEYGPALGAEGQRLLGIIRQGSQTMDQLTTDLLELARIGKVLLSESAIDMHLLATKAFEECAEPEVLSGFRFVVAQLPQARADAALVRQVWINLLSNAVKYSAVGSNKLIEVDGEVQGEMTVYSVRDHGAGFDQRYVDKLFRLFQRLHSSAEFPGTGVGLAIVKRIVVRHGGEVWANGRLGEGAVFKFSLPRGIA